MRRHKPLAILAWIIVVVVFFAPWRFLRSPRHLCPGVTATETSDRGRPFTVVRVDLQQASINLYWNSSNGQPFRTFSQLKSELNRSQLDLAFAANAGIFAPGLTPLGLHVENGHELVPINLSSGAGNFYLKPNGIFMVDSKGARIIKSNDYQGTSSKIRLATQSGPLLVIDGQINPVFRADSTNLQIRSGVGVVSSDQVDFVLSDEPVTFHRFARFFRDRLQCRQALYLDGAISRFYPFDSPANSVKSDFAGILAISANGRRLPRGKSPGAPATSANSK